MEKKSLNKNLHKASAAKKDEFYTQYNDIQKEIEAYLEFNPNVFRGKVVYCNCVVQALKGGTSYHLRKEFLWGDSFWADGYFAETVGAQSFSAVKKYIKENLS